MRHFFTAVMATALHNLQIGRTKLIILTRKTPIAAVNTTDTDLTRILTNIVTRKEISHFKDKLIKGAQTTAAGCYCYTV